MAMKVFLRLLKVALLALFVVGCSPIISTFDQVAYSNVTSLKVDALALMDKSTEDYPAHANEVAALQLELDKAIEYDAHRPHNAITNDQWKLLSDPAGHLLGGFLAKWKREGKESPAYVTDKKKQIGESFDQISELEIKKIHTN